MDFPGVNLRSVVIQNITNVICVREYICCMLWSNPELDGIQNFLTPNSLSALNV